jgi:hypothetical protein
MKGSIYLYRHLPTRLELPYGRLRRSWGLTRASKELAQRAQTAPLDHSEIQSILLNDHPELAKCLGARGIELCALEQGVIESDIAKFLRQALHESREKQKIEAAGWQIIKEKPNNDFPDFSTISRCLLQPDGPLLDELIEGFQVKTSLLFKTIKIMRKSTFSRIASVALGLGFSGLSVMLKPLSRWLSVLIDLEDQVLDVGVDACFGLIAGLAVVGVPLNLAEGSYLDIRRSLISVPAWRALKKYSEAEKTDFELAKQVAQIIQYLEPKECKKYLLGLGYQKVCALSPIYEDKDTLNEIILELPDAPSEAIKPLLQDTRDHIAWRAFERSKELLVPQQLAELLSHRLLEIRRGSFNILADLLSSDELGKVVCQAGNIPEILAHEKVTQETKGVYVKKIAVNMICAELLETFSEKAGPEEIKDMFDFLSDQSESPFARENLIKWVELIIDHEKVPPSVLFEIARNSRFGPRSLRAMQYLAERKEFTREQIRELRRAKDEKVRALACLCDQEASIKDLVCALASFVAKSNKDTGILGFDVVDLLEAQALLGGFQGIRIPLILAELQKGNTTLVKALLKSIRFVGSSE